SLVTEFALYYVLHHAYKVLVKSSDIPLPERNPGYDITWLPRQTAKFGARFYISLARGVASTQPAVEIKKIIFSTEGENIKWEDIEPFLQYYPVQLAGYLLLGAKVTGKEAFIESYFKRPHVRQCFLLYRDPIAQGMRDLEVWRKYVSSF